MIFNYSKTEERIIRKISSRAEKDGVAVYLVGGFVRDMLLGRGNKDMDIMVIGEAVSFAQHVADDFGTKLKAFYKRFGTALLELSEDGEKYKIEFASARKESYKKDSRKPIVELASLGDDLSRRDFTINTLAMSLNKRDYGELIDRFEGLQDLENKLIRTPLEPKKTFSDDPLRIMRAIRFASQLSFEIEKKTFEGICEMRARLHPRDVVSQERITDEFLKILQADKPSVGLTLLQRSRVLEIIFPEIAEMEGVEQRKDYHHKDVFYHTLQVVDNICKRTDNIWLRLAALMHDVAKPATKKFIEGIGWTFHGHEELGAKWQKGIFKRLRLPLDKVGYVSKLVRLHLRPIALADEGVTDTAIRRLIRDAGDDLEDLMMLCRADITSKDPRKVREYSANFDRVERRVKEVEERDRIRNFQSPVRGDEIMQICNIGPGKLVGILKKKIEEAILEGEIPNEYEAAKSYLYKIRDEIQNN
jgi:poly(A) polymerase